MKRTILPAIAAIALLAGVACSGGGGVVPSSGKLATVKSVSPAAVKAAPMVKTAILPASAMGSPKVPSTAVNPPSWTQIPGTASQVAAAADGSVWVLSDQPTGSDKYIWHYSGGTWTNISGAASEIAVAPDGTLYAINSAGGIYKYSAGAWTSPGFGAKSIAAIADGTIVVISSAGSGDQGIWHLGTDGVTWTQLGGAGVSVSGNKDPGSHTLSEGIVRPGGAFVTNSNGDIYALNTDSSYVRIPGTTSEVTSTTGGLIALGANAVSGGFPLFYFDMDAQTWSTLAGSASSISAAGGSLDVVNSFGQIFNTALTTPTIAPTSTPTSTPTIAPTSTPTGTPTSPPTAGPILANGNFETGNLTGWYICRAGHPTLTAPIDQTGGEAPQPTYTQGPSTVIPAVGGTPIPDPAVVGTTAMPSPNPASSPAISQLAGMTPHGGSYAAQIGSMETGAGFAREKGLVGICQDIAVPSTGTTAISAWVWEGGNTSAFPGTDSEMDIFSGATWVTGSTSLSGAVYSGMQTTADPTATLFAETNCYNPQNTKGGTATFGSCAIGGPNNVGGVWQRKGPYDLSAYAGTTVTVLIGQWSGSNSTGYYDFMFTDDVSVVNAS